MPSRQCFPVVDEDAMCTLRIKCGETSPHKCFVYRASPTRWGKRRVNRQNAISPLRQVELGSRLGDLCIGKECSGPQSKHLVVVNSALDPKATRPSFNGKLGKRAGNIKFGYMVL